MNKPLFAIVFLLAGAYLAAAQEINGRTNDIEDATNVALPFAQTSAAQTNLFSSAADPSGSQPFETAALSNSAGGFPVPRKSASQPKTPSPFEAQDQRRWQVSLGVEFLRFESNVFTASLVGTNTAVDYLLTDWVAVEGNLVTGFAPAFNDNNHVKYFGGAGGVRVGEGRERWEPWVHALVGGAHLQPQTAAGDRSSFSLQAGIGLDLHLTSVLSVRAQTDYVYTRFFSTNQHNFQAALSGVIHF